MCELDIGNRLVDSSRDKTVVSLFGDEEKTVDGNLALARARLPFKWQSQVRYCVAVRFDGRIHLSMFAGSSKSRPNGSLEQYGEVEGNREYRTKGSARQYAHICR